MFLHLIFLHVLFLSCHGHELKQVIVLSRHNIRAPWFFHSNHAQPSWAVNIDLLTPKKWPAWNGNPGDLTPKGRLLERHMGKYFADWMIQEGLFANNCPTDEVFVYANSLQRTRETAKSFAEAAFGDCVGVYYKNITQMDPVFNPIVKNDSSEFRETILNEIQGELNKINLTNALIELDRMVDFGNSLYCKAENVCDLSEAKNKIVLELNKIPDITGTLKIGWILVDYFLMAYYDGMAHENVAWGQIQTDRQWESLLKVLRTYHELRFESPILAKEIATNLLEYMTDIFQNGRKKFYLLVGHDMNISLLTTTLRFKNYVLHDQLEKTPIGGKLVFQKWHDDENDLDLLRVNYVYQSFKQIRDGAEISLLNPPQWETLEMEYCAVDKNGFCPWNNFISYLSSV